MKNIQPLNENVKPEETPASVPQHTNQADAQSESRPDPQQTSVAQAQYSPKPAAQPSEAPSAYAQPPDPASIYPTVGSQVTQIEEGPKLAQGGRPASVFLLSILLSLYGLYLLYALIKTLSDSFSAGLVFSIDIPILFGEYQWLAVLLTLVQIAAIFFAAWGVWNTSKTALAFVTGFSFFYLKTMAILTLLLFQNIRSLGLEGTFLLLAFLGFVVGQVLCWTKDRSYFT